MVFPATFAYDREGVEAENESRTEKKTRRKKQRWKNNEGERGREDDGEKRTRSKKTWPKGFLLARSPRLIRFQESFTNIKLLCQPQYIW